MPNPTIEYWLIFAGDQLLIHKEFNSVELPTVAMISHLKPHFVRQHFLGLLNNANCYCAEIEKTIDLPKDLAFLSLKKTLDLLPSSWYVTTTKAFSILNWDRNHYYCGRCGNTTEQRLHTFERACSQCGLTVFPRISPSVIVLIKKDDQILMARSSHFPPGVYGLIAGFVEAGESLEDAVHREVKEEVNLEVKNLQYFTSQSWPFPDSLMTGFIADYAAGELIIDPNEIEKAGWYRYDELPGRPSTRISISSKLIDHYLAERTLMR